MSSGVFGKCLVHFTDQLKIFILSGLQEVYKTEWEEKALNPPGKDAQVHMKKNSNEWDLICLINIIHDHWDQVFDNKIVEKFPKAYFTIIRFYRNRWAHQTEMNIREIYRGIDIMEYILEHINMDYGPLTNARQVILGGTEQDLRSYPTVSTQLEKFLCYKCYNDYEIIKLYKCTTCHIILCQSCMLRYFQAEQNWKCPKCHRPLNSHEIDFCCRAI